MKAFGVFEGDGFVSGAVEEDGRREVFSDVMIGGECGFFIRRESLNTKSFRGGVEDRVEENERVWCG